jgi:biotin transport system substrate-specific component
MFIADRLTAQATPRSWVRDLGIALCASFLIALFAPVSIHLPFTPVPIVLQVDVCLFLGALLGSRRGALAVLFFLAQGAMGLPVFAGCVGGIGRFFGPSAGYLIGYVVGAYITGLIVERCKERKVSTTLGALAVGHMAVFALGYAHLAQFLGYQKALLLGVLPFLPGDVVKMMLSLRALKALAFFKKGVVSEKSGSYTGS